MLSASYYPHLSEAQVGVNSSPLELSVKPIICGCSVWNLTAQLSSGPCTCFMAPRFFGKRVHSGALSPIISPSTIFSNALAYFISPICKTKFRTNLTFIPLTWRIW